MIAFLSLLFRVRGHDHIMRTPARSYAKLLVTAVAVAAVAACYTGNGVDGTDGGTNPNPNVNATGLDCTVAAAIGSCVSCHGSTPSGGAPISLNSDTALKATSPLGGTYAERSVIRMQDTKSPMPTGGPTPTQAADIKALQDWIAAGYPAGTCAQSDGGTTVYPTVCTSGTITPGSKIRERMHPGGTCLACHTSQGEGPSYTLAGTVFSTLHEKDDCAADTSIAGSTVVITGADKKVTTLTVNSAGNFFTEGPIAFPYTAKVLRGGKEHAMVAAQSNGDCNSCHSEQGNSGAPGRITAP